MAGARGHMGVTHEDGVRFAVQLREHRLVVDQPLGAGAGQNAGPMPLELLGAGLGTCVALYVQQFLHTRGLPYAGMRVEVEAVSVRNPSRVGTYDVRVMLPQALPPEYAELLERVARSCPAHNTLVAGAEVAVRIEAGVEETAGR